MMKKRNTFTRAAGATYPYDVCGRRTRHTGVQSLGSKTCAQCWDLAGIENEIHDGYTTQAEQQTRIDELLAEITKAGGSITEWAALQAAPAAEQNGGAR